MVYYFKSYSTHFREVDKRHFELFHFLLKDVDGVKLYSIKRKVKVLLLSDNVFRSVDKLLSTL